eukprot:TRINITY_DN59206_c0_g1_i1.p1 TRINITY_DN59206_c0_g1~~TRINITY_DN59206_c0_g1_i1.p1  ORF type:complete len:751 (-),score=137.33 TRINITY_DN59206_c0_g1_i1:93-2345(-)
MSAESKQWPAKFKRLRQAQPRQVASQSARLQLRSDGAAAAGGGQQSGSAGPRRGLVVSPTASTTTPSLSPTSESSPSSAGAPKRTALSTQKKSLSFSSPKSSQSGSASLDGSFVAPSTTGGARRSPPGGLVLRQSPSTAASAADVDAQKTPMVRERWRWSPGQPVPLASSASVLPPPVKQPPVVSPPQSFRGLAVDRRPQSPEHSLLLNSSQSSRQVSVTAVVAGPPAASSITTTELPRAQVVGRSPGLPAQIARLSTTQGYPLAQPEVQQQAVAAAAAPAPPPVAAVVVPQMSPVLVNRVEEVIVGWRSVTPARSSTPTPVPTVVQHHGVMQNADRGLRGRMARSPSQRGHVVIPSMEQPQPHPLSRVNSRSSAPGDTPRHALAQVAAMMSARGESEASMIASRSAGQLLARRRSPSPPQRPGGSYVGAAAAAVVAPVRSPPSAVMALQKEDIVLRRGISPLQLPDSLSGAAREKKIVQGRIAPPSPAPGDYRAILSMARSPSAPSISATPRSTLVGAASVEIIPAAPAAGAHQQPPLRGLVVAPPPGVAAAMVPSRPTALVAATPAAPSPPPLAVPVASPTAVPMAVVPGPAPSPWTPQHFSAEGPQVPMLRSSLGGASGASIRQPSPLQVRPPEVNMALRRNLANGFITPPPSATFVAMQLQGDAVAAAVAGPAASPMPTQAHSDVEAKLRQWLGTISIGNDAHRGWDDGQIVELARFARDGRLEQQTPEEIYRRFVEHQVEVADAG